MNNFPTLLLTGLVALVSVVAAATSLDDLQGEWARIRYESPVPSRAEAMTRLKATADIAVAAQPDSAELLIWDGVITASLAGLTGGTGGLSLAKEARALLEQAQARFPGALHGSALITLGALYTQAPVWPIGFGSSGKARTYLEAALRLDRDGIDPNYFYADFLLRQGDYSGARVAAQRALSAPPRAGREVADKGRRGEVQALLERIEQKASR